MWWGPEICSYVVVDVIVELKVWCDLCEKPVGMGVGCMYFFLYSYVNVVVCRHRCLCFLLASIL